MRGESVLERIVASRQRRFTGLEIECDPIPPEPCFQGSDPLLVRVELLLLTLHLGRRAAVSTGRSGKRVGKAGIQTGKAGGIVFAGAMTRSPYSAYQIGKRGGKHLIGPGASPQPDESSEDADIDWSTQRDGPGQATTPPWDDDTGGDPSETV